MEAQAIEANRQAKEKLKISFQDTSSSALASTSKTNDAGPSGTTNIQVSRTDANSSITLVYTPPPRRIFKRSAALQSPYAEAAPKIPFKCRWGVSKVYNAVCMCSGRSARGNNRKYVCIHPATYFQSYFYLTKKFLTLFFLQGTRNQLQVHLCCTGGSSGLSKTRGEVEEHHCRGWHLCSKWQEQKWRHQICNAALCHSKWDEHFHVSF